MQRTCAKCGHINDNAETSAAAECPQCGVIYAKAALTAARQRQSDSIRQRVQSGPDGTARPRSPPTTIERICWLFTMTGAAGGVWQIGYTALYAESAPQQAAGAAMAVSLAAVPYCLARAIQLFNR